ncbi:MAG: class I SAM-dependent methyltransferase [Alphaproteobacteria bacterium]|nr:class I SAM-dependent methyltransferase [Alphaproteobacteria bacterium]
MALRQRIVAQFKQPHGALGHLAGILMANRPSNRARNLRTVDLLDCQATDRVLEIGCGPGIALKACVERVRHGHVTGLDHSSTMIDHARYRLQTAIAKNRLTLVHGGLEVLPAIGQTFDRVYSVNVAQFFSDLEAAYRAIIAVMNDDGRVATTYMPRHRNPTPEDAKRFAQKVAAAMERAGYADIRFVDLPLTPAPAVSVLGTRPRNICTT